MHRGILNALRPVRQWIQQSRNVRPTIKIGKDRFQLTIDVRHFNKDELRVKARQEYIVIEGKQERKLKNGCVMRQFVRKFKLPKGCDPSKIESKLSDEGVLTIIAQRDICDQNYPCETGVPINFSGPSKLKDAAFVRVDDVSLKDPCEVSVKVSEEKAKAPDDKKTDGPSSPAPDEKKK